MPTATARRGVGTSDSGGLAQDKAMAAALSPDYPRATRGEVSERPSLKLLALADKKKRIDALL